MCHPYDLIYTKADDAHMMRDDDASFYVAADADVDAAVLSKTKKESKKENKKKRHHLFIALFYVK